MTHAFLQSEISGLPGGTLRRGARGVARLAEGHAFRSRFDFSGIVSDLARTRVVDYLPRPRADMRLRKYGNRDIKRLFPDSEEAYDEHFEAVLKLVEDRRARRAKRRRKGP